MQKEAKKKNQPSRVNCSRMEQNLMSFIFEDDSIDSSRSSVMLLESCLDGFIN